MALSTFDDTYDRQGISNLSINSLILDSILVQVDQREAILIDFPFSGDNLKAFCVALIGSLLSYIFARRWTF